MLSALPHRRRVRKIGAKKTIAVGADCPFAHPTGKKLPLLHENLLFFSPFKGKRLSSHLPPLPLLLVELPNAFRIYFGARQNKNPRALEKFFMLIIQCVYEFLFKVPV